jgi:hypothetical protein
MTIVHNLNLKVLALLLAVLLILGLSLPMLKSAHAMTVFFSEDFESGSFGSEWSTYDLDSYGADDNGNIFENDYDYWGIVSSLGRGGSKAAWCAGTGRQGLNGSYNTSVRRYDNYMRAYLRWDVDLTGKSTAWLSFWYNIPSADPSAPTDLGLVYIKKDGNTLALFTPSLSRTSGWQQYVKDISAWANQPITIEWRWVSDGQGKGEGLYIDDVQITDQDPGAPPPPEPDIEPPAIPTGLTATGGDQEVTLNWNANSESDLLGYNLYRAVEVNGSVSDFVKVNFPTPISGTSYTDTGLTNDTTYYYKLTAVDTSGNESTATAPVSATPTAPPPGDGGGDGGGTPPDTTPPTIIYNSPGTGATGVSINTSVVVTFSEAMNSSTINTTNFTIRKDNTFVNLPATVTYDQATKTATLTPVDPLEPGVRYIVELSDKITDLAGNPLPGFSWSFTTGDTTSPTIISTYPSTGASNVPLNVDIKVTFSKDMDASTINTNSFTIRKNNTFTPLSATVTYDPTTKTAILNPTEKLEANTTYIVEVKQTIKDTMGNSLSQDYSWSFTTGTTEVSYFLDVSSSHWAVDYIVYLTDNNIISGYPDNTFRPSNNITRAEFAKIVVMALGASLPTSYKGYFPDVPSTHWAWKYIEKAKELGILKGYPDGSFRPGKEITRAEIAKMVVNAGGFITNTSGSRFPDVPPTHWAYNFIMTAKNEGIVGGYPDGTFRPDNSANRAEAAKMVYIWLTK